MTQQTELAYQLFDIQHTYRENALKQRRFKQKDILPLIAKRKENSLFEVEIVGESFEGRVIQMLKIGSGKTKVLLWTQMHGNEPTATMASFDIFNFFEAKNDGFDEFRKKVLQNTTLYFVPMLNPDGAEHYQRRTRQGIDMNRDAFATQTPEAKILKNLVDEIKPDYGFNLHDQNPKYTAGKSSKLATISFLATSYDYELSINPVRERSMQLIVGLNRLLQNFIPDQVARFSDDHEPRAFGDNIQKWGTTLILIESGGYVGDPEKQYIRQLNFVAILSGLHMISDNSLQNENREEYYKIPENGRWIHDLIIRNMNVKQSGKTFQADLGIDREEINYAHASKFFYQGKIEDFGDLHTQFGNEELDATGLSLEKGKVYPTTFKNLKDISILNAVDLLKRGYTYVQLETGKKIAESTHITLPLHVLQNQKTAPSVISDLGSIATFVLKKGNKVKYVVVNGFLYDMENFRLKSGNGILE